MGYDGFVEAEPAPSRVTSDDGYIRIPYTETMVVFSLAIMLVDFISRLREVQKLVAKANTSGTSGWTPILNIASTFDVLFCLILSIAVQVDYGWYFFLAQMLVSIGCNGMVYIAIRRYGSRRTRFWLEIGEKLLLTNLILCLVALFFDARDYFRLLNRLVPWLPEIDLVVLFGAKAVFEGIFAWVAQAIETLISDTPDTMDLGYIGLTFIGSIVVTGYYIEMDPRWQVWAPNVVQAVVIFIALIIYCCCVPYRRHKAWILSEQLRKQKEKEQEDEENARRTLEMFDEDEIPPTEQIALSGDATYPQTGTPMNGAHIPMIARPRIIRTQIASDADADIIHTPRGESSQMELLAPAASAVSHGP